jgi:guanylate kinase
LNNVGENEMSRGSLYIVSAPSGAGKTSLVTALIEKLAHIEMSVSHTTRAKRAGEESGVHYHFVDVEQFQQIVADAGFLESAEVFGNFYGTSQKAVEEKLNAGIDVILEIDWQGAQQVRKLIEDSISVFIMPPSSEALKQRLTNRGQDSDDVISKRMSQAKCEMSHYSEYDYLVINDDFDEALNAFCSIIIAERQRLARQTSEHQDMINSLLS